MISHEKASCIPVTAEAEREFTNRILTLKSEAIEEEIETFTRNNTLAARLAAIGAIDAPGTDAKAHYLMGVVAAHMILRIQAGLNGGEFPIISHDQQIEYYQHVIAQAEPDEGEASFFNRRFEQLLNEEPHFTSAIGMMSLVNQATPEQSEFRRRGASELYYLVKYCINRA